MKKRLVLAAIAALLAVPSAVRANDFKTYRNGKYGFQFRYPTTDENGVSLKVSEFPPNSEGVVAMVDGNYGGDVASQALVVRLHPGSVAAQIDQERKSYDGGGSWEIFVQVSDTRIGGRPAKKMVGTVTAKGHKDTVVATSVRYLVRYPSNSKKTLVLEGRDDIIKTFGFIARSKP